MAAKKITLGPLVISLVLVAAAWAVMFAWQPLNFWLLMTASQALMITASLTLRPDIKNQFSVTFKEALIGLGSALLLYLIFVIANELSTMIFGFAKGEIASIYEIRTKADATWIGLLLLFIIGPGEEIYWRGLIQSSFSERFGPAKGFILTTALYAGVHIVALNFMLFGAAAVCGLFWGLLYTWRKNLFAVVLSHAVWDVSVLVLFPIT
jgi:membrane protease YdiL (CAAX protease family)